MPPPNLTRRLPLLLASLCGVYLAVVVPAQSAPPAVSADDLARFDTNKNGVLDPDEVAAKRVALSNAAQPAPSSSRENEDLLTMSPFEVKGDSSGYMATNSASGTRLNSRLEDIASPISVVTKQQLTDLAAVDLNDIFRTEANVEGLYQYSEISFDRNQVVDTVSNNPENNNRIRGMGQANIAVNGMAVSNALGLDTYNIDSVEINRGPNSNIFGIGSTSGTVNLNRASANVQRDSTRGSVMVDSLGGHRETYDINRVIGKNKLAIRLLGAYQDKEFVRAPSYETSNRFTAAVRFQPFKSTTIRASFESTRLRQSLPNNLTPREGITPWRQAGAYTWDPYNFTVYDANDKPVHQYSGVANPTTGSLAGFGGNQLNSTYRFVGGSQDSAQQRPTIGYIDGGIAYWTSSSAWIFQSRSSSTQANTYAQQGDQRLVDYSAPPVQIYVPEINPKTGQPFGLLSSAFAEQLIGVHGPEGKAFYNWDEYNINAANRAYKGSETSRFEIEQNLIWTPNHKLAVQVAGMVEQVTNKSWNFIGNGGDGVQGIVYIDVNRHLPNGDPNPGYMRPYIRARQPQRYDRPEKNDFAKVQLAYLLTTSHNKGWTRWLGDHNFVAYGEKRQRRFSPGALRFRSMLPNASDNGILRHVGNTDSLNTRYYLGDAVGGNIDDPTTSPPPSGTFPYTYWSTEFGGTGSVRFDDPKFRTTDARIEEIYFSQGTQKNEVRTAGAMWQGYLLKGRIVPTMGIREDRTRFKSSKPFPTTYQIDGYPSSTFTNPYPGLWDFNDSYIVTNSRLGLDEKKGQTRSEGVVVKPLPNKELLSFYYNQSSSFDPAFLAIDTYGNVVDDPTGKDQSYGARLNFKALKGDFYLSLNRYKNVAINARNAGANVVAVRALPFDVKTAVTDPDFEGSGLSSPNQKDLFGWYFYRIFGNTSTTDNPTRTPAFNNTGDLVYMQKNNLIGATNQETFQRVTDHVYDLMQYDKEIIRRRNNAPGAVNTATNDVTSQGYELELMYQTRDRSIKLTGSKKETIDSNVAASLSQYIAERMPILQAAKYTNLTTGTTDQYWTTVQSGSSPVTHGNAYYSEVLSVYNPLIANLGKPRPQVRTYALSLTSRLQLRALFGNKHLQRTSIGGNLSWASKGSIGFRYKLPTADPVTGALQINELDGNQPIYDKARWNGSVWARYDFRLYRDRIRSSLQLNVNNVLESHSWLQPVAARSDGQPWAFRIVDPRVYMLTWSIEL